MQDQSNPSNESNPPVSEVVVLAKNAGEEGTLASNDDYALKPDRGGDGRTIVSNDDSTLNTVSDESDKGSTLSARLSRATTTSDASTRASASTTSRLQIPSISTHVLQSKIDKMTDEQRQAARNTASALIRTIETKVAVKSLHRDVTENHQEAMTGQKEILTKMDEQPAQVAAAVMEHLTPILDRLADRRRCEDGNDLNFTPARARGAARTPARGRTPMTASCSARRSEKRSRPPRSAAMSSKKAARIPGFDCHVKRLMGE